MTAFRVTMTATALVLALAAARADPYVGTDNDGNLQLRSAQGQGVFANNVDLVRLCLFPSSSRSKATPQVIPQPVRSPRRRRAARLSRVKSRGIRDTALSTSPANLPMPKAVWQKSDEDVPEGTVGTVRRGAHASLLTDLDTWHSKPSRGVGHTL